MSTSIEVSSTPATVYLSAGDAIRSDFSRPCPFTRNVHDCFSTLLGHATGDTSAFTATPDGSAQLVRAVPFGISARQPIACEPTFSGMRFYITLAMICYATFDDFDFVQPA